jgi:hypothetical protein
LDGATVATDRSKLVASGVSFWCCANAAADAHSLPANVVDDLVEQARAGAAREELEFFDSEIARALAHAIADVPNDRRAGRRLNHPGPIEMAFAKLKAHLRAMAMRTIDELGNAIGQICDLFTPEECANSFQTAGYGFK